MVVVVGGHRGATEARVLRLVATLNFLSMKCPDFPPKGSLYHLEMENVKKKGGPKLLFLLQIFEKKSIYYFRQKRQENGKSS